MIRELGGRHPPPAITADEKYSLGEYGKTDKHLGQVGAPMEDG